MGEIFSQDDLVILGELERKVLWLASWTIHHANHVRENTDGLKVGGHHGWRHDVGGRQHSLGR
jgi:pyruvate dehydrogenase complex dehydrogenase (E1) component